MDAGRALSDTLVRLRHRHGDSWQEMIEMEGRDDPSEHDVERSWGNRRIFRCVGCDEDIMIEGPGRDGQG